MKQIVSKAGALLALLLCAVQSTHAQFKELTCDHSFAKANHGTPESMPDLEVRFDERTQIIQYGSKRQVASGAISDKTIFIGDEMTGGWVIDRFSGEFSFIGPMKDGKPKGGMRLGTCKPSPERKF